MPKIKLSNIAMVVLGSAILAFGLFNIHSTAGITEGGILGLTLLLKHHFNFSPALTGPIMDICCYLLGFFVLGKGFIVYSLTASGSFAVFYSLFERLGPVYANIDKMPFIAAILGAIFVGVGIGLCVRTGGAPGGDDALALSLSKLTGKSITLIYLTTDLIVLVLSISYIPLTKIAYSLLTVILSGQLIGFVSSYKFNKNN